MSDSQADNTVSRETPPPPMQQPAPSPPAYTAPPPPQQVACPNCYTLVPVGTHFCPQCGNAIPPPSPWPPIPAPPAPSQRGTLALIIGIVLIALLILGVAGYTAYHNAQQQAPQAAKNSETNNANQAINLLQFTCFSSRNDTSHLSYSAGYGYSGYSAVYETFGVSNPTSFTMDITWTLTLAYPSAGWVLTNSQPFHLSSHGEAFPTFTFTVSGSQLNNTPSNANFTRFTVTLDGTCTVTGTYATYNLNQHSTYDSSTNTGNGTIGSGGTSLPKC